MSIRFSKKIDELHNENQLKQCKIVDQQHELKSINDELEETKQLLQQLQEEKYRTKSLQNQINESYTGLSFSQANIIGEAMFEN